MPVAAARQTLVRVSIVAVFAAVLALAASPAYAWDAVKSSNGLVLLRESDDATGSADIFVYYDYKGGATWNAAYPAHLTTSYNLYVRYTSFLAPAVDAIEVPLVDGGGRVQLVYTSGAGCIVPVIYEPLRVSVVGTSTVSVAGEPTVQLSSTLPVSIDSTLPVQVTSVGAVDSDSLTVLVALLVLTIGGIIGYFTHHGWGQK